MYLKNSYTCTIFTLVIYTQNRVIFREQNCFLSENDYNWHELFIKPFLFDVQMHFFFIYKRQFFHWEAPIYPATVRAIHSFVLTGHLYTYIYDSTWESIGFIRETLYF